MVSDWGPADFVKCPECHRSGTARIVLCADGDVICECTACDAFALGEKRQQTERIFE